MGINSAFNGLNCDIGSSFQRENIPVHAKQEYSSTCEALLMYAVLECKHLKQHYHF